MKYFFALVALAFSSLVFADTDSLKLLKHLCDANGRTICQVNSIKRTPLGNKLAHYEILVSIGNQPFNKIGLHRIVKEKHPGHAYKTKQATMLIHGDVFGFSSFISSINSSVVNSEHSIAVQMAKSGIDVWGIDLRWTQVPVETTNFDFMKEWGLERDLNDLDIAMNLVRGFRKTKGNYDVKLNLLGWSRGGQLGYLYLAKELNKYPSRRNVKTFIPVDALLKTDDAFARQSSCQYAQVLFDQFNAGKYFDETGLITQNIAQLSQYLPDEPSPILEGLTNKQTALLFLTSTYLVDPTSYTSWYHYNAGEFDVSTGMPTDLAFTDLEYMYEFAGGISPYMSTKFLYEALNLTCEQYDSPLDDRLHEISVPIFYVYSAGGFGRTGLYTANLTSSRDVSELGIATLPTEFAAADFGHIDLFTAYNANELVWQPVIHWIKAH
jgi:pimeloyl-ACP methyl ester carboxylesterase